MVDNSNLSLLRRNLNDHSIESIQERLSENSNSLSDSSGDAQNKFTKIENPKEILRKSSLKKLKTTATKITRKSFFSTENDESLKQNKKTSNFQTDNNALIKSKRASLPGFNSLFLNNLRTFNNPVEVKNTDKRNTKKNNVSGNLSFAKCFINFSDSGKNVNIYSSLTSCNLNNSASSSFEANFMTAKRDSNKNGISGTFRKHRGMKKRVSSEDFFNSYDRLYISRKKIINKMKILHFFLAVFSLLSIIFSYTDTNIYNKNSWNFLIENFSDIFNDNNVKFSLIEKIHYEYLEKRKITNKENAIRIINMLLNIFCALIIFIIHWQRNKYIATNNKGVNWAQKNLQHQGTQNLKNGACSTLFPNTSNNSTLMATMVIMEENMSIKAPKYYFIFSCLVNLAFYPPYVNKVFIHYNNNYYYVYTLNNIFLLINYAKILNIFRGLLYISNINSLPCKMVCKTFLLELDYIYMFKIYLNKYPFILTIILLIIFSFFTSIFIKGTEYYSINSKTGFYDNKGYYDFKSVINSGYLYFFISLRIVFGDLVNKTPLGKLILFFSGILGSMCCSYFIYLINKKIELTDDEEKAFSKLSKLFEPENNEHKASDLIRYFLFYKKIIIDNNYLINTYKLKIISEKKDKIQSKVLDDEIVQLRKSLRMSFSSDQNKLEGDTKYKLREKFIKYIEIRFIHKMKFLNENRNFRNKFKISRNYSLPFNDVIKTLVEKMEANMDSLCFKLEPIRDIFSNMDNLTKINGYVSKKIAKIIHHQHTILEYLIKNNNDLNKDYYVKQQKRLLDRSLYDDDEAETRSNKIVRKVKSRYVGYQGKMTRSSPKMKISGFNPMKKTKSSFVNKNDYLFQKKPESEFIKHGFKTLVLGEITNGKTDEGKKKRNSYDRPRSNRDKKKGDKLNNSNIKLIREGSSKKIIRKTNTIQVDNKAFNI